MIFDGRGFARSIEEQVRREIALLSRAPQIASVVVGDNPASELYTRLKKSAAERVGIQYLVVRPTLETLAAEMKRLAEDKDILGVMVQLPIPGLTSEQTTYILSMIPPSKDVDGLEWRVSHIKPAAVSAILSIVAEIARDKKIIAVLGSAGAVGTPLTLFLRELGYMVLEIEKTTPNPGELTLQAEVIISCVGKAGLVTIDMVRSDSIVIDVGMSEVEGKVVGDMTPEVYQKALIAVTVPGGVGPVTVASLMRNTLGLTRQ